MPRVVINECFGGFGLSDAAIARLRESGWNGRGAYDIARDDPRLVSVVEELGEAASGSYAKLAVVDLPDGVKWHIDEYDGSESIHEDHRTWDSRGLSDSC